MEPTLLLSASEFFANVEKLRRHLPMQFATITSVLMAGGTQTGLAGEEIPLLARIIAVADAYNAMTSDRPYRDAMPSRVARLRLAHSVEHAVRYASAVAAFEAILAVSNEDYCLAKGAQFALTADDVDAAPIDKWSKHAGLHVHIA